MSSGTMTWALVLIMSWHWSVWGAAQSSEGARPIGSGASNAVPGPSGRNKPLHPVDMQRLLKEGGQLNAGQAEAIVTELKARPQDEAARARLLGYYAALASATPPSATPTAPATEALAYARAYSEAVEAVPFSVLVDPAGMSRFSPLWIYRPCFETVAAKWVDVAKRHPGNAFILARAGTFLTGSDTSDNYAAQGRAFLQEASALEPQDASRMLALADRYLEDAEPRFDKPEGNPAAARKALGCLQEIWSGTNQAMPAIERQKTRGRLTRAAFWAGDYVLAKRHAQDWLASLAGTKPPLEADAREEISQKARRRMATAAELELLNRQTAWEWNRNQAIHDANMIQGEIALSEGKSKEAGQFLVDAGKISGRTLTLSSYGPDLALVRDLLAAGERQAVINFFDECAAFWTTGKDSLSNWKRAVEAGEMPDFGPGFHYQFKRLQASSR